MRWPFRRRAAESGNPEPVAVERPQHREWSALPPLPGTFGAQAPLVIGPAPVLPPLPGRREPMPASEPVLRGSVQGIASVIKPVRFDREAAEVVHRPVRRRPVVVTPIEPVPLTYVDDQHVSEPREPKVPHRAPAWLRYTPPAWMTQQNEEPGGLPDLGLPLPIMETPPPPPPPPPAPVVRPKPERRANLGQSRRLGLGAPISSATQPAADDPAPEEPAPALIHEPASVAQEPAPLVHEPAPVTHESVPAELATAMRQTHNVEVADVPVVRGPVVSAEARSHGARAFTRAGKVHLPDEAGPLTSPKARGLIAHELVHAVQQRTLGLSLPSPSSDHGQALEAEAVAAERFYAGEAAEPPPLIHAPRLTPSFTADTHTQLAPTTVPTTTGPTTTPTTSTPPQQVIDTRVREEVDRVATDTARRVVQQEWQNPSLTPQQRQALGLPPPGQQQQSQAQQQQQEDQSDPTAGYLEAAVLSRLRPSAARHVPPSVTPQTTQSSHGPLPQSTAATVQPQSQQAVQQQQPQQDQEQDAPADSTAGYLEAAVLGRLSRNGHHLHRETVQHQQQPQQTTQQQSQSPQSRSAPPTAAAHTAATTTAAATPHQVDINDLDLEELSARLYTRLRSRLRLELLVDRERAGQLSDYR
ncbi:eCIS core domain-containing protein [Kutzneria sp. CA-103260]|uniref:eCIS core domain-containing protein n=1 Tax=Kutzneria sp. CA-103260 TaxID=2802641 RepID=UPI001BA4A216|nr:DUF4157 domain-containing protein [Kutzneria sp. CA-103260]QUQ62592.1 hypothetical protein JJ691_03040 [Kutzneria sp. CA-103260]